MEIRTRFLTPGVLFFRPIRHFTERFVKRKNLIACQISSVPAVETGDFHILFPPRKPGLLTRFFGRYREHLFGNSLRSFVSVSWRFANKNHYSVLPDFFFHFFLLPFTTP